MSQKSSFNNTQPHKHGSVKKGYLSHHMEGESDEVLDRLRSAVYPETNSEVLALFDEILERRSGRLIETVYDELSMAGMHKDLSEIAHSLTLRAVIMAYSEFKKAHNRFPDLMNSQSSEEFLLASWSFFFLKSPDQVGSGVIKNASKRMMQAIKNA